MICTFLDFLIASMVFLIATGVKSSIAVRLQPTAIDDCSCLALATWPIGQQVAKAYSTESLVTCQLKQTGMDYSSVPKKNRQVCLILTVWMGFLGKT